MGAGEENAMSRSLSQDALWLYRGCMEGKAALAADLPNQTLPSTPCLTSLPCTLETASGDEIQGIMVALVSSTQPEWGVGLSVPRCWPL